ncbi:MAG TPA: stage III sporulation protein AE [Candidatus Scatomorpha intestinavium]|uniref:Stage III sporulation protein AE n=1 Tax=Candidatus Scatomorpha intestinavium TaxID=2840922 RepID=A0A9D0ZDT5_9FIRM|nr:stage III sporulation protein AE [Candidatus Scatomorpha intestinavium]
MDMLRTALISLLCAMALILPASASDYGASAVEEALPEEAREIIGSGAVEEALEPEGMLSRLWEAALSRVKELFAPAAGSAAAILCAALLCSAVQAFADGQAEEYVTLAGVLAVTAIAIGDARTFISAGTEALGELNTFSHALLPSLTAAAAAGGAVTSAAAKYAATALFMDVLITAARGIIIPLAYIYMAAAVAHAATGSAAAAGAAGILKWLAMSATALIMTAFTAYLSISGAVSGAADAVTLRTAKSAISTALPVVGGIISDAAGTVVAGAGLIKGAVGSLGLVATAAVCLTPFISLGLQYLMYKLAAALAEAFAPGRLPKLISSLGGVFGMVLGVVGAAALMLFISVASLIRTVAA